MRRRRSRARRRSPPRESETPPSRSAADSAFEPSEDVDRRVHDDPHNVDEVPVDTADLDAVMVLGREMAAEGTGRHEREDRQTDEDVGPVEAGETEEDRR